MSTPGGPKWLSDRLFRAVPADSKSIPFSLRNSIVAESKAFLTVGGLPARIILAAPLLTGTGILERDGGSAAGHGAVREWKCGAFRIRWRDGLVMPR
jgi:hypothetical protein